MINIDNNKKVVQPYVSADGNWHAVQKEAVMVNGEWQTVFEKDSYNINLFVYGKYLKTLTCKKGGSVSLERVSNVYYDDYSHHGWCITEGSTARNYSPTGTVYPQADMNLYACFEYFTEVTRVTCDATSVTSEKKFSARNYGPDTVKIEGCIEKITTSVSDGSVISTTYEPYQLHTDGTKPYVKIESTYIDGTLGSSDGATSLSVPVVYSDVVRVCGISEQNTSDSEGNNVKSTLKIAVHYKNFGAVKNYRTVKETFHEN